MRFRPRSLWLTLLLVALVFGAVALYCGYEPSPIRYDNLALIEDGMTRAEVEELLGCPPGNHATGPVEFDSFHVTDGTRRLEQKDISEVTARSPGAWVIWHGDRGVINVRFDKEGKVQGKFLSTGRRAPPKWQRWFEQAFGC